MIFSLFSFLQGYLRIYLRGRDTERYLNLCSKNDILLWNLKCRPEGIFCSVKVDDYKRSKPYLKKTGTHASIKKKTGLPFLVYRYRKRWFFFFCCILAILLLYFSSGFIWRIEVKGNSYISDEKILKILSDHHWFYGSSVASLQTETVEKTLRNELSDVIWVTADLTGTCLTVEVKEKLMQEEQKRDQNTLSGGYDLVATENGIVDSIITRSGTPKVAAGDTVRSGDVLISGIVDVVNATTGEVSHTYCEADGDVVLNYSITYDDSFLMKYQDKKFTGREQTWVLYCPHQQNIFLPKWLTGYQTYDTLQSRRQLTAGNGYFLPVDEIRVVRKEFKTVTLDRSREDAKEKVKKDFSYYLQNLAQKGIQTIEKNVIISYKDGKCMVHGILQVQQFMNKKIPSPTETAVEEENDIQ